MSDESDTTPTTSSAQVGRAHRLLLVEDEAVIRFVLRCELELRGFEVTEVEDGRAALEQFERDPDAWSGAFVDFMLPDTRGDHIIDRLLERRPDLPVVLMTGDCDPQTDRIAAERKVPILRKPFPLERVRPLLIPMTRHPAKGQEQRP